MMQVLGVSQEENQVSCMLPSCRPVNLPTVDPRLLSQHYLNVTFENCPYSQSKCSFCMVEVLAIGSISAFLFPNVGVTSSIFTKLSGCKGLELSTYAGDDIPGAHMGTV